MLKEMERTYTLTEPTLPEDLCYLYGSYMDDYLYDVDICQHFASRNREKMAEILLDMNGLCGTDAFHTIHHYVDVEARILRKGAVSAKEGQRLLIPLNMRDGSLVCVGKGNADWNFSAPHGAGRLLSRKTAKETLSMEEYVRQMEGIYSTSVLPETLDESPMAYKRLEDIVEAITPTADILERIRPIYNFKAAN